jgi:AraC-like DNA-binding protein
MPQAPEPSRKLETDAEKGPIVLKTLPSDYDPGLPITTHIRGGLPPRVSRRVREYLEARLDENISVQALAGLAKLSISHFTRAFKQSEGLPPHEYLVRCRVQRVQELLAETDLPLAEIALASGFSDQSHCARRFREHVGLTPSRYRWSMR